MDEVLVILLVPFDILARMNGPDKIHAVVAASLDKLGEVAGFLLGIRQPPVGTAVVGVVLRAVEVGVHLVLPVEIDERHPHLVRPGIAVESLDNAPVRQVGIVIDGHARHFAPTGDRAAKDLPERLDAIESTALVIPHDAHPVLADRHGIGSRPLLDTVLRRDFGTEIYRQLHPVLAVGDETESVGKLALLVLDVEPLGDGKPRSGDKLQMLRCRIDDQPPMVNLVTGDR